MTSSETHLGAFTQQQLTHVRSLDFVRFVAHLAAKDGSYFSACHTFPDRFPRSLSLPLFEKALVNAATTSDSQWAGPLAPLRPLVDAFIELARPRTLLGRIPGLRHVPFNTSVANQTGGGSYSWVGQGKPAPVTSAAFDTVSVPFAKAAAILVITDELARLSTPSAVPLLRDEMANGMAQFLDQQFVDPAVSPVAGISPGSITNSTTPIVSAGTSQANAATDIQALLSQFIAANPDVEHLVLLMKPANAIALARATSSQTLGLTGGSLFGIPVVTSASVGDRLIALDAARILVADEGEVEVDASKNATLEMDSVPTDPTAASTVFVSLYQRDLVGLRVTRIVNWQRAQLSAVKFVSAAAYV